MTEIEHLQGRIPKKDTRTTVSQMHTTWRLSQEFPEKRRTKQFKAQARSWEPAKKTPPWQTRPKIREIEVEQEPEQSVNYHRTQ